MATSARRLRSRISRSGARDWRTHWLVFPCRQRPGFNRHCGLCCDCMARVLQRAGSFDRRLLVVARKQRTQEKKMETGPFVASINDMSLFLAQASTPTTPTYASTTRFDSGRAWQARIHPLAFSAVLRASSHSIVTVPSINRVLHWPQIPERHSYGSSIDIASAASRSVVSDVTSAMMFDRANETVIVSLTLSSGNELDASFESSRFRNAFECSYDSSDDNFALFDPNASVLI